MLGYKFILEVVWSGNVFLPKSNIIMERYGRGLCKEMIDVDQIKSLILECNRIEKEAWASKCKLLIKIMEYPIELITEAQNQIIC